MEEELQIFDKELQEQKKTQVRSFLPSVFVMASLPLKEVKKNVFIRKYNNVEMTLHSVNNVPYGQYGRLILSLLTTHAVLNTNDTVELSFKSLNEFTDSLKLPRPRGKDVLQMLNNFVNTTLQYTEKEIKTNVQKSLFPEIYKNNEEGTVTAYKINTGNITFLNNMTSIELVDENGNQNQKNIAFSIQLNEKFVKLCREHAVPINYTVYKEISSPMGKDLYAWLVYRNNFLKDGEPPLFISKKSLVEQFNPLSADIKDKRQAMNVNYSRIKEQVLMIKEKFYPELNVWFEKDGSGMLLTKSPAVILPEDTRYVLITS